MPKCKLHLGCGKRYIPGYIHIDLSDYEHIDYRMDIKKLSIFKDNSVDVIYCCHALEYFDRYEAKDALIEWHRILKSGGILRLAVPDFENICYIYSVKKHDLDSRGILGPLYGRMKSNDKIIYHKTVYDFKSLKKILEDVGFRNVHRYDWRDVEHSDVDDYSKSYIPHLCKDTGILISLNVECTKK